MWLTNPESDIGLIKVIKAEGKYQSGTRIGDVAKGESAVIKTPDTTDAYYLGGSKSHKEVNLTRYKQTPELKKEIEKLEKSQSRLKAEVDKLDKQEYELLKPYVDPDGKEIPQKGKGNPLRLDFGSVKDWILRPGFSSVKEPEQKDYSYLGQTKNDQFIPGMSGSAMFNQSGELVGVATAVQFHGQSSGYGIVQRVYPPLIPESTIRQAEVLSGKKYMAMDRIREIRKEIFKLKNPTTNIGVSPKAIVSFLEKACSGNAQSTN